MLDHITLTLFSRIVHILYLTDIVAWEIAFQIKLIYNKSAKRCIVMEVVTWHFVMEVVTWHFSSWASIINVSAQTAGERAEWATWRQWRGSHLHKPATASQSALPWLSQGLPVERKRPKLTSVGTLFSLVCVLQLCLLLLELVHY